MAPRTHWCYTSAFLLLLIFPLFAEGSDFRVPPYLQNPSTGGMTVIWFSNDEAPGQLTYSREGEGGEITLHSDPVRAEELAYPAWEVSGFFGGEAPTVPFRHRVRLEGLAAGVTYSYTVEQGESRFSAAFSTAPAADQPIRFIAYADSETEPESTGKHVGWTGGGDDQIYPLDQTDGYAGNLAVIRSRQPDFITISGDLVESGGEQRDWDEFWRHIGDVDGSGSLAGRVPFLVVPGNHEYYSGPSLGRYSQPASEQAIARFLTYFEFAGSEGADPGKQRRYYHLNYGPVALIGLDVANGSPHQSEGDTNFFLLGEEDSDGGGAPAFGPGSEQYAWLEEKLAGVQQSAQFTFVFFHHVPYSVGPHGWPAGEGEGFDTQSGVPVRALTPLFMRYGVDAVIAGHDEIWERSEIEGVEIGPGGGQTPHTVHFLDVGIGGDGLRPPQEDLENPYQRFLAHSDAPEIWRDGVLVDGGKHYGHLEVDVLPGKNGSWQAVLKPVYIFPMLAADGSVLGNERRVYDDIVTLDREASTAVNSIEDGRPVASGLEIPYPNPFNSTVLLRYSLEVDSPVKVAIYDLKGQLVRSLVEGSRAAGYHSMEWDARNGKGDPVSSGIYLVEFEAGVHRDTAKVTLAR